MAPPVRPVYNNMAMCLSHALFLHPLPKGPHFLWPLFFAILSAILTQYIRYITPGVRDQPKTPKPPTPATTGDGESTASPDPANHPTDIEAGGEVHGEDPPPYAPPSSADAVPAPAVPAAPEEPAKVKIKGSSATLFVLGTAAFIPLLISIICLALSIQWLNYCQAWSPSSVTGQVLSWLFFFLIPGSFATTGVCCWAMLLRNLWGPAARKKYHFKETAITLACVWIIMGVIALPLILVGKPAIWAVERCQKSFCGDALIDEEVEIGELRRVEEVEAEMGPRVGDEEIGEGSEGHEMDVEREEESAGLIKGMEK